MNARALIAVFLFGLAIASGIGFKVHGWRVDSLKEEWKKDTDAAVAATKLAVQGICDANNQITKENAHALQLKYDATLARYYQLLRYTPSRSGEPATAGAAGRSDGTTKADVPTLCLPVADLATAGKLNDDQAAALITLQDIVAEIYRKNGQENLLPKEYHR